VFVAAGGLALSFTRQYAAYRERHPAIPIVPDRDAAWKLLGLAPPTFD
jgi:hypothetical protein